MINMIVLSLPLGPHPTRVVGQLDLAVRHLPDAQHLEHQDSKRPHIAPETQFDFFPHNSDSKLGLNWCHIFKISHRLVYSLAKIASGAVHLIGCLSFLTAIRFGVRANPKSAT